MKKLVIVIIVFCMPFMHSEDIFAKPKAKKEMSVQKMKEELAHNYEQLLHATTKTIQHLSSLIDDIVGQIKQLAGEEQGSLQSTDKQIIKQHQQKIEELEDLLDQLQKQRVKV